MAKRKKRGRKKQIPKNSFGFLLNQKFLFSLLQIGVFAAAGLILVSFSRQGSLLVRVNDLLVFYLGWASVFLPFLFLSFGFSISKFKTPLGQLNVVVGFLLFFISIVSITRSGEVGRDAFAGIASLVTSAGAFVILLGTSIVGLIVLFNTSFDQVLLLTASFLRQVRKYLVGERGQDKFRPLRAGFKDKKELKVIGDSATQASATSSLLKRAASTPAASEDLSQKLVSNLPGEEKIWKYPSINILSDSGAGKADRGDIKGNAAIIEQTLESFGVTARVVEVNLGPAVTQYALEVALGTKLSKITGLERDLALALAAPTGTIRIEAPIPGRSLVGIELPNRTPEFVPLKKMLSSDLMAHSESKLLVSLGLDVAGKPVVSDISKMPHSLIAGQTGSGKSVCINAFLASLLFRASPSEVKLILVDPKRVELTSYNGIPHLLTPVITEPEKVISALRWVLAEMDRRYKIFAQAGARNIDSYNEMSGFQALPYIVLVIDELADIMLFSPVEVEDSVTRIAQMSRATGIHMVLATQRPSVDVITGLIKANIPCRIAFAVASQVDSRVILDSQGAEKLLGKGDMLYLPPDQAKPLRIQGAYVSDHEVRDLVSFLKNQGVTPQYTEEVTSMPRAGATTVPGMSEEVDDLFRESVALVCQYDRASASLLQRRLKVGYARAARIIDQLESAGVVAASDGSSKPREVLIQNAEDYLNSLSNQSGL